MNKHILLVMKWLNDKGSVSQEELEKNKNEAWIASAAATADRADYDVVAAAAYWAAEIGCRAVYWASYWVDLYFGGTNEDKNEYLKELNK